MKVRTQAELENLYDYIADGAILRFKARWYEEGEKYTKYFLSLEKGNKSKSCIRRLINDDSIEITDQADVRKEIKTFYENLYTKKSMKTEQESFEYLATISTPQLSKNDKAICERKLTLQNTWEALNSMKNGKTPGNDGLTKEFYVCFFEEMGSLLLKSRNYSHAVGELFASQKQAVITLTEKKRKR